MENDAEILPVSSTLRRALIVVIVVPTGCGREAASVMEPDAIPTDVGAAPDACCRDTDAQPPPNVSITCPDGVELAAGECMSCRQGWRPSAEGTFCKPILPAEPCPAGTMIRIGDAVCVPVGWTSPCSEGWDRVGWPRLPAEPCPAGTTPRLGEPECQTVGWVECPSGFEPDPSGWGCQEVLPEAACRSGTIDLLGHRGCQPIGPCDEGRWGVGDGRSVFVDATAGEENGGTEARPFRYHPYPLSRKSPMRNFENIGSR